MYLIAARRRIKCRINIYKLKANPHSICVLGPKFHRRRYVQSGSASPWLLCGCQVRFQGHRGRRETLSVGSRTGSGTVRIGRQRRTSEQLNSTEIHDLRMPFPTGLQKFPLLIAETAHPAIIISKYFRYLARFCPVTRPGMANPPFNGRPAVHFS